MRFPGSLSRFRALSILLVPTLTTPFMSACGGGSQDGNALATAVAATDTQRILSVAATAAADVVTWTRCASEGQHCTFTGQRDVRYGTATTYVTRTLTDGTNCSNAVFGDPVVGTVKSCWFGVNSVPFDSSAWTVCAAEHGVCSFTASRRVRYGTPSQSVTLTFTAQTPCTNGVFGDPAPGIVKTCWYSNQVAEANTPSLPPVQAAGATGTNYPIVINASTTAHPGDVVSLQGENFGSTPRVVLDGADAVPLQIVNRVATNWLAVQLPATAPGALILRVSNDTGTSAQVKLNAAKPLHLDSLGLVPGGVFRLFGRNLMVAGGTPTVTVDGLAAAIDLSHSDEHMLTATAPKALQATNASVVVADNGNGSGPAPLDRTLEVTVSGSGDPFQLGVGWGAGFAAIAGSVINASTDSRLPSRMTCDGQHDDSPAIQAAIELAAAAGGGVVQLPVGTCRMAGGMNLRSRVVIQGAGKASTQLVYESNYPLFGVNLDLAGIRNLTLSNSGSASEGPLLKNGTRLFMQNVRVQLKTSRQMYLTGNRHFVVANCDFEQGGSIGDQGPYLLNDSAGLVFEGNTTLWMNGAPAFWRVHDSYIHANHFTRDGRFQNAGGTVHGLTMDFAHRIAVVGNTFDVANGPITNTSRNDGETLLTEGGGAQRTENLGTVGSAASTTLSDPGNTLQVDPFGTGVVPENYGVAIVGGKGAGQTRRVVAYSQPTITVDRPWDVVPDTTSHYATFVWGLEKSLIKNNVLVQNPRGIWLYHTAIRDVAVVGNALSEGGGIYLRSYQKLATKSFMPQYNVLIAGNSVSNTTGQWMSYINAVFVNSDARDFGMATIGIEIRDNQLSANRPNVSSQSEEYAGTEGYMNLMRVENYSNYETPALPRLLGTIFSNNLCTNCDVAVRIGTGAGGTVVLGTRLVNGTAALTDWATTSSSQKSTDTLIR